MGQYKLRLSLLGSCQTKVPPAVVVQLVVTLVLGGDAGL